MATAAQILTGPPAQILGKRGAGEPPLTFNYWEHTQNEDGSPVESYSADEARVVRDIFVDHRDRLKAAKAFAGYARVLGQTDRLQVTAAAVAAGGSGGTNGTALVVGTTGSGSVFQARVTVAGGAVTAVLEVTYGGSYTAGPTSPAAEPVAGGPAGAQLNVTIGPLTRRYISRLTPEPYRNVEAPWLWCTSVAPARGFLRGDPSDSEIANYKMARLTLQYTNVRYRVLPDDDPAVLGLTATPLAGLPDEARLTRYVSRFTRKASKLIAIPTGQLFYVAEGSAPGAAPDPDAPVGESVAVPEPRLAVTFVHHMLPAINWQTVWNCQFCVNDAWWPDRATGYPPGTLLYDGPDVVEKLCPFSADLMLDVQHAFTFAPNVKRHGPFKGTPMGWNSKLRLKDGMLDYFEVATTGGDRPFPAVFFGDLFRP